MTQIAFIAQVPRDPAPPAALAVAQMRHRAEVESLLDRLWPGHSYVDQDEEA